MESRLNWFERQARNTKIDIDTLPSWILSKENIEQRAKMTRPERIQALIQCFLCSFTEGLDERTPFDLDVIKTLTNFRDKYR